SWARSCVLETDSLLHQMGNGFALENKAIDFSNKAFGADSSMDYTINGSTIVDKFSDNSKTYPLMLLDYNGMSYFNPEDYDSELQLLYGIYDYVITKNAYQFALMNNTIISMGTSVTQTSGMSAIAMAQSTDDNYVFVIKKPTHSGFFCYDANFINFTETEKKIFDTLLSSESEIYFKRYDKKEAEYYLPKGLIPANCEDIPEESKPFINHGIDEKTKKEKFINDDASNANSFNFKSSTFTPVNKTTGDPIESFDSFYQYVHFCLTNQISTDGET
ncbi:MAG: hypothetical protein K2M43_01730, partial [Mycoplasmoidaceae bacterium]|nr:hypothetical protein [Mycoplasmoidaceae bacterium]